MWPEKVIARIEGGLGNQLFQYAAARSFADRLGCDLALDLRGLAQNGDRPYQLDLFRLRAEIADERLIESLPPWRSSRWGRVRSSLSQYLPAVFSYPVFWPRSFAYDARVERIRRPVYFVGYWQSERYFAWNRSRLLQDIQLVEPLPPYTPWLDEIRRTNSVALHIRRGDYVTNAAASRFHGLCDLAYYQEAFQSLSRQLTDLRVFVFSDEPQWAKANLRFEVPTQYVESNPAHVDLELMRECRHHIIANSSFSWWGAWLCKREGQVVYAPRRWFSDPGTDTSDVVPSGWIKL